MIKSRHKESNAALAVVIRIWIVSLAILAAPALGAVIIGLGQCKDIACANASTQTARFVGH